VNALSNEVAVVTGASSGIGEATAMELARHGAKVVLAARRIDRLHEHELAIRAAGGEALSIATDVTDSGQVRHLVKEAESNFGRIDILVNNAGVFWTRPFAVTPPEDLVELVQVNLLGAMLTTRAALPGMLERRHGAVINVSSVSGRVATEPIYSASKYGLRGFSLALRRQVSGTGVSVSCVEPGNIRTEMTRHVPGRLPGPEVVAEQICRLVQRPRREVVVPPTRYPVVWLEEKFPALADVAYHRRQWSPVR
jgi:NAD(P)-dependent dehydrogenase (short-subunit alcohol dehydrogenase family)